MALSRFAYPALQSGEETDSWRVTSNFLLPLVVSFEHLEEHVAAVSSIY